MAWSCYHSPPHTSHKLQPLDVGLYGPFKTYCSVAANDWMTSNPGKPITIKQVAQLTKIAYQAAFTQKNITKGFEKPGLWPVNTLAFKEEDFQASYVNLYNNDDQSVDDSAVSNNEIIDDQSVDVERTDRSSNNADIPSTSSAPMKSVRLSSIITSNQGEFYYIFKNIMF